MPTIPSSNGTSIDLGASSLGEQPASPFKPSVNGKTECHQNICRPRKYFATEHTNELGIFYDAPIQRPINTTAVSILQLVLLPENHLATTIHLLRSADKPKSSRDKIWLSHKRSGFIPKTSTDALGMLESPDTPS